MDLTGKLVMDISGKPSTVFNQDIDISLINAGVYVVSINDGIEQFTTRLVIVR